MTENKFRATGHITMVLCALFAWWIILSSIFFPPFLLALVVPGLTLALAIGWTRPKPPADAANTALKQASSGLRRLASVLTIVACLLGFHTMLATISLPWDRGWYVLICLVLPAGLLIIAALIVAPKTDLEAAYATHAEATSKDDISTQN